MSDTGSFFTRDTQAIMYNFQQNSVQRMLDFDFIVKRTVPSLAALCKVSGSGFHKCFFGKKEILLPVHPTVTAAAAAFPQASVLINFASSRSAYASSVEALSCPSIKVIVIIAEGVPERDVRLLIRQANEAGVTIIGPATVGGIRAGCFKIGDAAGTIENIIRCNLYRPGHVGFVSKSGGMSNECYNMIASVTTGIAEGIAIGGDQYPCSTFLDNLLRFEKDDSIVMHVLLGEVGESDIDEWAIVDALKNGLIKKPLVAWVAGTCAALFSSGEVQFGHAGARGGTERASAAAKNAALADAGAHVPTSFDGLAGLIHTTFKAEMERLGIQWTVPDSAQAFIAGGAAAVSAHTGCGSRPTPKFGSAAPKGASTGPYPTDAEVAEMQFIIANRKHSAFVSTISDDRGDEPKYCGVPISKLVEGNKSIGDVLGLLWFKRELPAYATKFLELCMVLTADHGPCVSGAHNTIVATRAGKDVVSSLCSGLLTIGPRFGGALDESASIWRYGVNNKMRADALVEEWKKKGTPIAGIGHRIKSVFNPDRRVSILAEFGTENFPRTPHLSFARAVEAVTTKKAPNLILNVDGVIAALFLDMLSICPGFSTADVDEAVDIGTLNGLFVLARRSVLCVLHKCICFIVNR